MPAKKNKPIKKQSEFRNSEDGEDNERINHIDVQYNPAIVASLINELQAQVEAKCQHIQKDSEFLITSIQQAYHLELIRLPTQVKQMTVKRFKEEFGDSLEAVTRGTISGKSKSNLSSNSNQTYNKSSRISQKVFQTPSHNHKSAPMRNPREGEVILSSNGSPLGEFTTMKKATKENMNSNINNQLIPPTPGVFIPLKSGDIVDMYNIDMDNLSAETRADAINQMQTVLGNMEAMLAKLRNHN